MKKKPNIDAFIEGGAADKAEKTTAATAAKEPREQKLFRLPLSLSKALKRAAFEQSEATGNRVTETDLVEQALHEFFSKKSG